MKLPLRRSTFVALVMTAGVLSAGVVAPATADPTAAEPTKAAAVGPCDEEAGDNFAAACDLPGARLAGIEPERKSVV